MMEFLAMGRAAAAVWPAYGVAAAILGGLLAVSLHRTARHRARLERLLRAESRRPTGA